MSLTAITASPEGMYPEQNNFNTTNLSTIHIEWLTCEQSFCPEQLILLHEGKDASELFSSRFRASESTISWPSKGQLPANHRTKIDIPV